MDLLEIIEDRLKKLKEKIDQAKLQLPVYIILHKNTRDDNTP